MPEADVEAERDDPYETRQAARSARGRDDVAAMLMEPERLLRRGELGALIDFAPLWDALDLEYRGPFLP